MIKGFEDAFTDLQSEFVVARHAKSEKRKNAE